MTMIRFCAVPYFAIAGLFLTSPSLANESADKVNCKKMQDYYASAVSRSGDNKDQYPHDIKHLITAAQCSNQAGNSLLSIEQYKFILGINEKDPHPWSELIYLQLEQVVNTLKSIIRHAPPRNDEERALVSQMMALIEAHGRNKSIDDESGSVLNLTTSIINDSSNDLWNQISEDLTWFAKTQVPGTETEIEHYLSEPDYFNAITRRANRYLGYIISEITNRDLPIEIALIPIIESSLNSRAISPRGAAGLWQIMPATAQQYRLTKTRWYDERFDIRTSTELALRHLEALNKKFDGNWLVTLSAYNSGSTRMQKIISKENTIENKWIALIPKETSQYLARVFALSSIVANPEKFGIELPRISQSDGFVAVKTGGRIELLLAAQLAGMELSALRNFNPGYLRWATPKRGYQELLMPPSNADIFEDNLADLPKDRRMAGDTYKVAYGDSVGIIADKLEVKLSELRSINNIRRNMIRAGETLLIPDTSYEP